ncbi:MULTISPECIES: hypothetical protein [Rhodococcus]|jgi:hypothetical protein|uniref:Uncharacterized protein n=1 Tax=Rhodococcus baikonurensis TaxID=172041 RepID=A0ABV5XQ30_9NOCA|nr:MULTISPECIES: hypothetical protein [Rhodococcus]KLN73016.1 hypothetical protein ABM90_04075 [Rhodococcus erythropolis]AZI65635.1 hypothetical protein EHW12_31435 [Rhodococcus sp. NJ-530]KSU63044.1 hypothetical protein AS032_33770 [Rhodococcus qingshengii]KZF17945.1 hypothetical protein A2J01_22295 [Rhodococcus sp. EPR-134]MDJ0440245.1 hypothetical protein [Rhodococcus qingshengii]
MTAPEQHATLKDELLRLSAEHVDLGEKIERLALPAMREYVCALWPDAAIVYSSPEWVVEKVVAVDGRVLADEEFFKPYLMIDNDDSLPPIVEDIGTLIAHLPPSQRGDYNHHEPDFVIRLYQGA